MYCVVSESHVVVEDEIDGPGAEPLSLGEGARALVALIADPGVAALQLRIDRLVPQPVAVDEVRDDALVLGVLHLEDPLREGGPLHLLCIYVYIYIYIYICI